MSPRLLLHELRKLWSLPMLPIFLLLSLVFNTVLCAASLDTSGYLPYIRHITATVAGQMGPDFDQALARSADAPGKVRLTKETAGRTDSLEALDAASLGELYISRCQISGPAAQRLRDKYDQLAASVQLLAQQDASLSLAAAELTKPLLHALFYRLGRAVLTESLLLAVMIALYLTGFERLHRTEPLVYTSRRGRRIQLDKLGAGGLSVIVCALLLAALSTLAFAYFWRLGPIWQASMASQFNYTTSFGLRLPFIPWRPLSIAGYLAATWLLTLVVSLAFYLLSFAAGVALADAYQGFLLVLLTLALCMGLLIYSGNAADWNLFQLTSWLALALWWYQPIWFTDMGLSATLPWQECWSTLANVLLGLALTALSYRYFLRKDV